MRTTRAEINNCLARIVKKSGVDMTLHVQSQMPGTWYRVESADGSRSISPACNSKEMRMWLEGYERALEEIQDTPKKPSKTVAVTFKLIEVVTPSLFAEKVHAACVHGYAIREGEKVVRADYA